MRRDRVTAFVALGANLGDARATVLGALDDLAKLTGTRLVAVSRLYRTAPHEAVGPDFINAVARMETELTAPQLLDALLCIEGSAGRVRPYMNAPRTLDLDLLLYGDARIDSPRLTVPHPRMQGRAFVLRPLADVAPERVPMTDLQAVQEQSVIPLEEKAP
ncbi:MAG: 2-amino-4-hydroxy-6-hydroxymethyldihydropteridine diphosphokinase [Limnohabitans sp.]